MLIKFQSKSDNIESVEIDTIFTVFNKDKNKIEFERIDFDANFSIKKNFEKKYFEINKNNSNVYIIEFSSFKSSNANIKLELSETNKVLAYKPTKEEIEEDAKLNYTLNGMNKTSIFDDLSNYKEIEVKDLTDEHYILYSINLNGKLQPLSRKILSKSMLCQKETIKIKSNNFLIVDNTFVKLE